MNLFSHKKLIVLIFILALFFRIFALFFVEPINQPKTWEYEEIANNILQGKGLSWTFYNTLYRATYMVLYPLLCSSVYILTNHSFLALKILQIIISLSTCFLIYKIALKLFNRNVAVLALFLVSLHPGLIYYSVRLHSLTLDAFLFTLTIFLFIKLLEGRSVYRYSILSGLSFGLALLSRTTIGLLLPFALVIFFFRFRKDKILVFKIIFLILVCVTLVQLPLWVRNYTTFKRIVITPNDSGLAFWLGYNNQATGTNKTLDGKFIFEAAPQEFKRTVFSLDEFGQNEYFYKQGLKFIRENPLRSLELFINKIKYFWWFTPTQGLEYPKVYFLVYKFYWMVMFALFIFGLYAKTIYGLRSRDDIYNFELVLSFIIVLTLAHASFNLDGRHRWSIEAFILIFSANGINFLCGKFCRRLNHEDY